MAQCEIGQRHIEPFVFWNLNITGEFKSQTVFQYRNVNGVRARREDALHNKFIVAVDWHRLACNSHGMAFGNVFAIDSYSTTIDRNVARCRSVFAITWGHGFIGYIVDA